MNKWRLLIVDSDDALREDYARQFAEQRDVQVEHVGWAGDGVAMARRRQPDATILGTRFPDMEGGNACRLMRELGVAGPILMISDRRPTDAEVIRYLDDGATDCLTKPVSFPVMLARVRAQLRTHKQCGEVVYRLGAHDFRPSAKLFLANGSIRIRLTQKEVELLKYLVCANGRPVNREELLVQVWGANTRVQTHTIETHIYRLRRKFEDTVCMTGFLVTTAGGYGLSL